MLRKIIPSKKTFSHGVKKHFLVMINCTFRAVANSEVLIVINNL